MNDWLMEKNTLYSTSSLPVKTNEWINMSRKGKPKKTEEDLRIERLRNIAVMRKSAKAY